MIEPFWFWSLMVLCAGGLINCGVSFYFNLTRPVIPLHFPSVVSGMFDNSFNQMEKQS